jgi:hypothetical protein
MLEVHTWEPNANSGEPPFCLKEKGVPFAYHSIDMSAHGAGDGVRGFQPPRRPAALRYAGQDPAEPRSKRARIPRPVLGPEPGRRG